MMNERKYVIFDADGTLEKSREFFRRVLRKILDLSSNSLLRQFYLTILQEKYCPKLVLTLWKKLNFLIYEISEKLEGPPRLFKGVREFLEKLSENQVKMFVSTTGSKSLRAEQKLEKLGILNFFAMVSGREFSKEEAIISFAKHLGIEQSKFCKEAFFVSDGLEDMLLAQRLGIYGIGITNTFNSELLKRFGAKKIIDNFEELIEL
jgi:phosphoglycolate phosphatase-like HAD superfamily hydrolase